MKSNPPNRVVVWVERRIHYGITGAGILRAREAMERSQYAGPAPVPFEVYNEAIRRQKSGRMTVTSRTMRQTPFAVGHIRSHIPKAWTCA